MIECSILARRGSQCLLSGGYSFQPIGPWRSACPLPNPAEEEGQGEALCWPSDLTTPRARWLLHSGPVSNRFPRLFQYTRPWRPRISVHNKEGNAYVWQSQVVICLAGRGEHSLSERCRTLRAGRSTTVILRWFPRHLRSNQHGAVALAPEGLCCHHCTARGAIGVGGKPLANWSVPPPTSPPYRCTAGEKHQRRLMGQSSSRRRPSYVRLRAAIGGQPNTLVPDFQTR